MKRLLAVCASLLIFTACSKLGGETAPTAAASSPAGGSVSTPAPSADPGATAIGGAIVGGGDPPTYTVDAPDGWSTSDGFFVIKSVPGVLGLSVWNVGDVTRDPCHWHGQAFDPGPTVDDLVAALVAQPTRHASEPTDVTLGGYQGRYLKWSVPADMEVTGDADFTGCDVEPSNGHRDFVSWHGALFGERYQQVAGQVDMLWVLDVDGQRLLIDATYSPDISKADRTELVNIAKSLRFNEPAA